MLVAQVTTPVPMRTATGRKSPRHFTLETETRCIAPGEQRKALKMPARKRPMFRILGLHPGYGSRFLAAAVHRARLHPGRRARQPRRMEPRQQRRRRSQPSRPQLQQRRHASQPSPQELLNA